MIQFRDSDHQEEVWKVIKDFPNYSISNKGNVRSYANNGYPQVGKFRELKQTKRKDGYMMVKLASKFGVKNLFVHRLVAEAFLPNLLNKKQVNHKSGIRSQNNVENLEWVTSLENQQHSWKELGRKSSMLGKFSVNNHLSVKIDQFDKSLNLIKTWDSMAEASKTLNINNGDIGNCCRGGLLSAGGFIWRYNDPEHVFTPAKKKIRK